MIERGRRGRIGKALSGLLAGLTLAACSFTAQAALLLRDINGTPVANAADATFVYDDDQNLTWLRNWNYAGTTMDWTTAVNWAADLTVGAFKGWRLPATDTGPSSNCALNLDPGGGFPLQYYGYNCTGSEMGHIWYTELGNTAGSLTNTGPFSIMQSASSSEEYWSGTAYTPNPTPTTGAAWVFITDDGYQRSYGQVNKFDAVAVRPGDVFAGSAPEPGSLALLGIAVAGLAATRRRRQ